MQAKHQTQVCKSLMCSSACFCLHLNLGLRNLTGLMCNAGAEIKISRPVEDKNPVVIARLGRDESKRTVTFYGHYDVQPAMEREWTTDPFEMNAIDGYYYGRGTSDNKVSPASPAHASCMHAPPQHKLSVGILHFAWRAWPNLSLFCSSTYMQLGR